MSCGASRTRPEPDEDAIMDMIAAAAAPVTLHVYAVGHSLNIQHLNAVTQTLLGEGGVFHGAIEIYGSEWSFGSSRRKRTGVFRCQPRKCPMHTFRQSVYLGDCGLGRAAVDNRRREHNTGSGPLRSGLWSSLPAGVLLARTLQPKAQAVEATRQRPLQ